MTFCIIPKQTREWIVCLELSEYSEQIYADFSVGTGMCFFSEGQNMNVKKLEIDRKCFHIVLNEPEIPQNTGNIARTCAATGTRLHLIEPMGFKISDSAVKRAGLDYWPLVDLHMYKSFEEFMNENGDKPMYFISTKGKHTHSKLSYEVGAMFLFGKETAGLGNELLMANYERTVRIPMLPEERLRSLNLANSVAVVLYEALRQHDYQGMR